MRGLVRGFLCAHFLCALFLAIFKILKFLKIHQKINFCSVREVTGKARSQEMLIFEVFEHLKIFENFGKLVNVKENL